MDPFTRYLPALETEMQQACRPAADAPPLLYGMIHYHLGWADAHFTPVQINAGKRLRPLILLLACEAQGGDWQAALPAAAAIELLHNFTLIHDDIEDCDTVRRGRATLWTLWGEAQAINAGDALFAIAYRAILNLNAVELPAERILRATRAFTGSILRITEGQCQDIAFEMQPVVPEADYLTMIAGKTAALIGLACELGGLLAGAGAAQVDALREFGVALGMAFQMQDDVLGLWGDPAHTGKPVGADLRRRKKTLPILHGIAHSTELATLLQSTELLTEADVTAALRLLEAAGSQVHTQAQAERYHRQALNALARSEGHGEAHAALHALAETLLGRAK